MVLIYCVGYCTLLQVGTLQYFVVFLLYRGLVYTSRHLRAEKSGPSKIFLQKYYSTSLRPNTDFKALPVILLTSHPIATTRQRATS